MKRLLQKTMAYCLNTAKRIICNIRKRFSDPSDFPCFLLIRTICSLRHYRAPLSVSIILPNYNHAEYLRCNLDGLLAQTHENWELHIVDDGSTDDSVDIIRKYAAKDSRIKPIFFEKNQGVLKAINASTQAARGDLFYGSAADDFISNRDFFKIAANSLGANPKASGFFGRATVVDAQTLAQKWIMGEAIHTGFLSPQCALYDFLHGKIFIPGVSSIWRRQMVLDCGGYDFALGSQADYYLNHALPAITGVIFSRQVVATCRHIENSLSAATTNEDYFHRHALVEKKFRSLKLSYPVDQEWFTFWRKNTIESRFSYWRQMHFINEVRAKFANIEPHERAGLSSLFIDSTKRFFNDLQTVEAELATNMREAQNIFNAVVGRC